MPSVDLRAVLSAVPDALSDPLIAQFEEGLAEYRSGDWEKVGIKAGKFCEIAYTICEGYLNNKYASAPSKPRNMFDACRNLENIDPTKERSIRIQIPRVLMGLYELRNNRAIGHVSGEIDPNHMDAEFYLRGMKWILAEFIRFFSNLPEEESRAVVEAVTARTFQIVWQKGDARRILEPARTASEKVLILSYAENQPIKTIQLAKWIDYKNIYQFRRMVLRPLHKLAKIHFDENQDTVEILPPGQRQVEDNRLLEQK